MNNTSSIFSDFYISTFNIPKMRISDYIDIFVVAVLIYIIMNWIRETRAWSLFKGILVVMVLNVLAYQLSLYTVSWIIQNTLSVGILAIIVLFQPEFRKGLEQIGKGKILTNIFDYEQENKIYHKSLDEIIIAVFKMANVRTGAIIIIERDVALGDFEERGISIDAVISSQLIINIFENKTPLHDGAVVIRNNRISSATCILPLTHQEIALDLGTRHRAAIGASEASDAYVIVVSEETGQVSVAHAGKLYRNLTPDEIRRMMFRNTKTSSRKIGKIGLRRGKV